MNVSSTWVLWGGIVLVLIVVVARWRLGVWDIESEEGPPVPSLWSLLAVILGLAMVGWASYQMIQNF